MLYVLAVVDQLELPQLERTLLVALLVAQGHLQEQARWVELLAVGTAVLVGTRTSELKHTLVLVVVVPVGTRVMVVQLVRLSIQATQPGSTAQMVVLAVVAVRQLLVLADQVRTSLAVAVAVLV